VAAAQLVIYHPLNFCHLDLHKWEPRLMLLSYMATSAVIPFFVCLIGLSLSLSANECRNNGWKSSDTCRRVVFE